jgi:hypothetical protein
VVRVPTWVGEERSLMSPTPIAPLVPLPHAQSVPSVLMAAMIYSPAETLCQVVSAPTRQGEERLTTSPWPRAP